MRRAIGVLALCALFGCGSSPTGPSMQGGGTPLTPQAPPLHDTLNQPGDFSIFEGRISYTPGNTTMFDDFTVEHDAVIRTVAWQGVYCQGRLNVMTPPAANATDFRIRIFLNRDDQPTLYFVAGEPPVHERRYSPAEAGERFEANTVDVRTPCPGAFYSYVVRLNPPLSIRARTKYWLNIEAAVNRDEASWGWRVGRQNNSSSLMVTSLNFGRFRTDQAFRLDD